jgi:hypothetical protein
LHEPLSRSPKHRNPYLPEISYLLKPRSPFPDEENVLSRSLYRGDSRPATPSEPSPKSRRSIISSRSLEFGFTLEQVVRTGINRGSLYALRRLQTRAARIQSCNLLTLLLDRKRLNIKFHAFVDLKLKLEPVNAGINQTDAPTIFPMNTVCSERTICHIANPSRPDLTFFAGLGKVVGVAMSVQRVRKLQAFRQLRVSEVLDVHRRN